MHRSAVLVLLVVVLVVAAACTPEDDDDLDAEPPGGGAPTTTIDESESVSIVAINQLHGLFCPEETDFCDAPGRLDLLWSLLEEAGCPDLVGLAEIGPRQQDLVPAALPEVCDGAYELLWDPDAQGQPADQEMVLSSLDVLDDGYVELAEVPWGAHWVEVRSPLGDLDLVMTHYASESNNPDCTAEICPDVCPEGTEVGTCHAIETVAFLDAMADGDDVQVVAGDLNRPADDERITTLLDAGFLDAWTESGQPECDPATGQGCTCCIDSDTEDFDGAGLDDPARQRDERIDFVLARSTSCDLLFSETSLFAGPPSDPAEPGGVVWPSDHAGVAATLSCA